MARDLPFVWVPSAPAQLTEIKRSLHGVTPQIPFSLSIAPEDWYYVKPR